VSDLRAALAAGEQLSSDLSHQARHDDVTGLPNRRRLAERIAVISQAEPGPHAVVFIDLDDFTAVNDNYGQVLGDVLLREMAGRLRAASRPRDVVARLGSDEFGVLLTGTDEAEAVQIAGHLLEVVSAPVALAGRILTIGASAGVATLDPVGPALRGPMGDDGSRLRGEPPRPAGVATDGLARADVAMYAAKRAGRGRVLAYTDELRDRLVGGTSLAADLVRAVADGSLDVAYQPIVDLDTGRITALEALVRWLHPELGPLSPLKFLPVAVERGIIAEIDLLVLDRALGQAGRWCAQQPGLRVGFNASAQLLAREDAVEAVLGALARHGLPGAVLTIEVTEQSMIDDPTGTAARLQRLRERGVSVSLDDFGTGYSSLSYLQELPVDVLKLDRSFITRGVTGANVSALVRSVVHLGHDLDLKVLAEGIETTDQRRALVGLGCDLGQGWLFATAMPAEQVGAALAAAPLAPVRAQAPDAAPLPAGLPSQSTSTLASNG
jgi:diguanylate cyclase (GGDEF)-like protein